MRTEKDVEAYLLRLNRRYRALEEQPGTFLVEVGAKAPPLVVRVEPPLVVVRVQLADVAADKADAAFYRGLLELNAKQLVHAAYGIDDGHVVLSSALELENLDFNELQATMDEIDMALAQPLPGTRPKN
ncbi:MAG: hypothetical protein ACRELB_26610 [Polyangiaceae bacterium]